MKVTNIKKEFRTTALVESESAPGAFYKVIFENGQMSCSCPFYMNKKQECKHIQAFRDELEYQREQHENKNA